MAQSIFQGLAKAGPTGPGSIGVAADATAVTRTESGVGAMMFWADALWFTTYPDENGNGAGMGLWRMGKDWEPVLVEETNGTHAGRATSGDYLFIGEHRIHSNGTVTRLTGWYNPEDRISGWTKVPTSPNMWAITMAGKVYKLAPNATAVEYVAHAKDGMGIAGTAHFKACWGAPDRLYMVSNGNAPDGRFGYMDIPTSTFTVIDANSYIEVAGSYDTTWNAFATGQNRLTGFLWLIDGRKTDVHGAQTGTYRRFLLPLTSQQQTIAWQQEWMRIRTVDTERFLMDFHGGWYALSTELAGSDDPTVGFPLIEPISRHTRTNTDFTLFDGKLVIGGNQSSGQSSNKYQNAGQPQSSIVALDSSADLLKYGKPTGKGYFYFNASVTGGVQSEYMLARGYDHKQLHLVNGTAAPVQVDVRMRMGDMPADYTYLTLTVPVGGHAGCVLPSADWVAVRPTANCADLTAWVVYS